MTPVLQKVVVSSVSSRVAHRFRMVQAWSRLFLEIRQSKALLSEHLFYWPRTIRSVKQTDKTGLCEKEQLIIQGRCSLISAFNLLLLSSCTWSTHLPVPSTRKDPKGERRFASSFPTETVWTDAILIRHIDQPFDPSHFDVYSPNSFHRVRLQFTIVDQQSDGAML